MAVSAPYPKSSGGVTFRPTVGLRHKDPIFRLVELSHPYPILLVYFVDGFTIVIMIMGETCASTVVSLVICGDTVLLLVFLLELIRFWLPYSWLLHQRVLFLAPTLVKIISMVSLPIRSQRHLPTLSLVL